MFLRDLPGKKLHENPFEFILKILFHVHLESNKLKIGLMQRPQKFHF